MIQRPRNPNALPLPARKPYAALSDACVNTVRQRLYKRVKLRFAQGMPQLLVVDLLLWNTKRHIFPDICIQQKYHLRDISYIGKPLAVALLNIHVVRQHPAALQFQKPQQNVNDRRLSRAACAHHTD